MQDQQIFFVSNAALQEAAIRKAVALRDDRLATTRAGPDQRQIVGLVKFFGHGKEEVECQAVHVPNLVLARKGVTLDRIRPTEYLARPDERRFGVDVGWRRDWYTALDLVSVSIQDHFNFIGAIERLAIGVQKNPVRRPCPSAGSFKVNLRISLDEKLCEFGVVLATRPQDFIRLRQRRLYQFCRLHGPAVDRLDPRRRRCLSRRHSDTRIATLGITQSNPAGHRILLHH